MLLPNTDYEHIVSRQQLDHWFTSGSHVSSSALCKIGKKKDEKTRMCIFPFLHTDAAEETRSLTQEVMADVLCVMEQAQFSRWGAAFHYL